MIDLTVYHYRPDGKSDSICGRSTPIRRHLEENYAVFHGYFLSLAQEYGPGKDLGLTDRNVVLCKNCFNHEEVALALLGWS